MQKWLDDIDIVMYSTHNEVKSVVPERFIRTLKSKIYEIITANNKKSYFSDLNKLVDNCNNSYCHSIGKKTKNKNNY